MAGGIAPPASCRGAYHARSPTTSERQTRCRQAASAPVGRGHTGEPQRRLPERRGPERRHPVRARTRWARWCPGEPGGSGWRPGWTPHRGRGHGVPGGQGGTGALSQGAAGRRRAGRSERLRQRGVGRRVQHRDLRPSGRPADPAGDPEHHGQGGGAGGRGAKASPAGRACKEARRGRRRSWAANTPADAATAAGAPAGPRSASPMPMTSSSPWIASRSRSARRAR